MAQCKPAKKGAIRRRWTDHLFDYKVSKNMERKMKEVHTLGIAYLFIMGILQIYRKQFMNPSLSFFGKNLLFLGTKSLFPYQRLIFPYQGLFFRKVRNLETRKFMDKYLLRISRLYTFIHSKLSISRRTAGLGDLEL